jgi:hypothetical protein
MQVFTGTYSLYNHQIESLSIATIESITEFPISVFGDIHLNLTKLQIPVQFHGVPHFL